MDKPIRSSRGILFGVLSLAAALGGFICWFFPYSPPIFTVGIVGLLAASLVFAIVAGFRNSRWWLCVGLLPLFLFALIVPQYEKPNRISLEGSSSEGVIFKLSGTGTIVSFTVGTYSADAQEPNDRRYMLWQVEPGQLTTGKSASEISTIRYGEVPDGYKQTFPEDNARPIALQPGRTYYVADYLFHRYFEMTNGRPLWVSNPPEEPCFVIQNGDKWVRVPCNRR